MRKIYTGVAVALVLASCGGSGNNGGSPNGVPAGPVIVSGIVARHTMAQSHFNTTGTILPDEEVSIMSEISGRIVSLPFQEGARVSKGQLLVKINDDELEAQLSRVGHERRLAADTEERQRQLYAIKAVSKEAFDQSVNALEVIDAQIALLRAQLDKTEIRAPFTGNVGLRNVSPGAAVSPGEVITTLLNTSPVKLEFSVPERHIYSVKIGDVVQFTTTGRNDTLTARIYARDPGLDPASRSLRFRALYPNVGNELLPGAFANVHVALTKPAITLVVPTQALIPALEGAKVYVQRNGRVVEQPVKTAERTAIHIAVTEGLQPGDTVITSGLMRLKPGMPVQVKVEEVSTPNTVEL